MSGFIQITDTHIEAPGALVCGRSDTAKALHEAVATVNAHLPLLPDLDCAMITGDPTDHGNAEEYAHFLQIMEALELPWLAVPGNRDSRETMRAALSPMRKPPGAEAPPILAQQTPGRNRLRAHT